MVASSTVLPPSKLKFADVPCSALNQMLFIHMLLSRSMQLYTPTFDPVEDAAFTTLLQRMRLIKVSDYAAEM
jgi:hypothetical protein